MNDDDMGVTDLGKAMAPIDGTLCSVKAGSRIAQVLEGLVIAHPDDPPYLVKWDGQKLELEVRDGAVVMPTFDIAPPDDSMSAQLMRMIVEETHEWMTPQQLLIHDLRNELRGDKVDLSPERVTRLLVLCRRSLDVLEDIT